MSVWSRCLSPWAGGSRAPCLARRAGFGGRAAAIVPAEASGARRETCAPLPSRKPLPGWLPRAWLRAPGRSGRLDVHQLGHTLCWGPPASHPREIARDRGAAGSGAFLQRTVEPHCLFNWPLRMSSCLSQGSPVGCDEFGGSPVAPGRGMFTSPKPQLPADVQSQRCSGQRGRPGSSGLASFVRIFIHSPDGSTPGSQLRSRPMVEALRTE